MVEVKKTPNGMIIYEGMLTYTNQNVHTSTKKTPENAKKSDEAIDVKTNLEMRALTNRKYPPLAIGDNVQFFTEEETRREGKSK